MTPRGPPRSPRSPQEEGAGDLAQHIVRDDVAELPGDVADELQDRVAPLWGEGGGSRDPNGWGGSMVGGPQSPSVSWDTKGQGPSVSWNARTVPSCVPGHMLTCCRGWSPQTPKIPGDSPLSPKILGDGAPRAPKYHRMAPIEPQDIGGRSPLGPKISGDGHP